MSFLNQLNSIANSLKRIAIALETQNGISNFPSDLSNEKSTKLKMFDSSKSKSSIEDSKLEAGERFEKEVSEFGKGHFFEEDVVSLDILSRL